MPEGVTQIENFGTVDSNQTDPTDSNHVFHYCPNGKIVVHKDVQGPNGENITDTSFNFTVKLNGGTPYPITDNGTVTYDNLAPGNYSITEDNPANYVIYSILPDSDGGTAGAQVSVAAGQTVDVFVVNRQKLGSITIHKVDNKGADLSGAVFRLYSDSAGTTRVGTYEATSNASGIATFTGLPFATYYVKEYSAPAGYALDTNVRMAVVNTTTPNPTIAANFVNTEAGSITIHKVDNKGADLSGAVFRLYSDSAGTTRVGTYEATSNASGIATFTGLPFATYYVKEYSAPAGYALDTNVRMAVVNTTTPNPTIAANFVNTEAGSITIHKVDNKGADLSGAVFRLYSDSAGTTRVGTYQATSNASGIATFTGLPFATYYVKEYSAPAGYALDTNVRMAVVNTTTPNPTIAANFVNTEAGSITIHKVDNKGADLSGAVFRLYSDSAGTTRVGTYEATSNASGIATFTGLPFATYYVKEYSAPAGYALDTNVRMAVVNTTTPNPTIAANFVNTEAGSITIHKVDNKGADLSGAVFRLYSDSAGTTRVGTYEATSNASGIATFTGLPFATYYVKEYSAPAGYALDTNVRMAVVNTTTPNPTIAANFVNTEAGSITIHKVDNKGADLSGAVFRLYSDSAGTTRVGTYEATSNASGIATFTGLPFATYYVKEYSAPAGYALDTNVRMAVVNTTTPNPTIAANFVNTEAGSITIHKVDNKGADLSGAVFRLYSDSAGTTRVGTYEATSNASGIATFTGLPFATYYVKEYSTPAGYALDANVRMAVVNTTTPNPTIAANFVNTEAGSITIHKVDNKGADLSGAVFRLYSDSAGTTRVGTYEATSNASGIATFTGLPFATYYVKEYSTPAGYALDTNVRMAVVNTTTPNPTIAANFVNTEAGSITIHKVDNKGADLSGAVFRLYSDSAGTTRVGTYEATSNASGIATFTGLPFATYYVKEYSAPAGYALDTNVRMAVVNTTTPNPTIAANFVNTEAGSITIHKVDNKGADLSGAVFRLYSDSAGTTRVGTYEATSNASGIATFTGLPFATYYVKEYSAPAGYALDTNVRMAVVNTTTPNPTIAANFVNTEAGSITIHKVDNKGAIFQALSLGCIPIQPAQPG